MNSTIGDNDTHFLAMSLSLSLSVNESLLSEVEFRYIFRFRCSTHEQMVGDIAREVGFTHASLSSQTMPMVRIVPRGYTGTRYFIFNSP